MTTSTSIGTAMAPRVHTMQAAVLDWYAVNGRDLAFRHTTDPWAILVSEVIAQQTQAARAAEAWTRLIAQYPTPVAMAVASPAEVIRAWRGLGYNRRALALRAAAIRIVEDHGGRVPDDLDALIALPGIGPYTARAVLAIAFNRPVAALDVNIRRVLGRALAPGFIRSGSARAVQATADGLVPEGHAATWTHALMDIGAAFCRPRNPRCEACPIRTSCQYGLGFDAETRTTTPKGRPGSTVRALRFESTTRWLRGRILDRLRDAPDGAWVAFEAPIGEHDRAAVGLALDRLSTERQIEAVDRRARLPIT